MSDLAQAAADVEQSRAEFRAALGEVASAYALALEEAHQAESRYAQDPDRDDLADQARDARGELDEARRAFDNARKGAKAKHTKRTAAVLAGLEV